MKKQVKTSTSIVTNLLHYFAANGWIKQYSLFIKLKSKYSNSIIYDYNINKIAIRSGLAHKTCKRYMNKLFALGCVKMHGDHLILVNQQKIWEKISGNIKPLRRIIDTRPWTSYKGIMERLQYLLIKENSKQQRYNSKKKSEINYRKSIDCETKDFVGEQIIRNCYNSSRQVARLFNISQVSGNSLIRNLVRKQYIRTEQIITKVKGIEPTKKHIAGLNKHDFGYYFKEKRSLLHHSGLLITYLI